MAARAMKNMRGVSSKMYCDMVMNPTSEAKHICPFEERLWRTNSQADLGTTKHLECRRKARFLSLAATRPVCCVQTELAKKNIPVHRQLFVAVICTGGPSSDQSPAPLVFPDNMPRLLTKQQHDGCEKRRCERSRQLPHTDESHGDQHTAQQRAKLPQKRTSAKSYVLDLHGFKARNSSVIMHLHGKF